MILLDNFSDEAVAEALAIRGEEETLFEASEASRSSASVALHLGVDRISLGALTHTIRPIDFGLDDPTRCS